MTDPFSKIRIEDIEDVEELRRLIRQAQQRAEESRQRAEEFQQLAKESQPQGLQQYLEACHSLNLAIQVVTDPSLTTQGDTTNPTGRFFPRRIIPWDGFVDKQEEVWDSLLMGQLFSSQAAFPSQHQLEYVKSVLRPITSELELRFFERDVVENAVQKLVDRAYIDPVLRSSLGLRGSITFESHMNIGDEVIESLEQTSLGEGDTGAAGSASAPRPMTASKARRKARGKGGQADQVCVYRTLDGQNIPVLAIEYKPPHKLSMDEVVTGLESEIQPERDVINKDGQGFTFTARRLTAAVITQLFSYMMGKSVQYGYLCTGEAFVFLHIPDDPATVYFSVCLPSLDVMDDDETRLHRTAAAQVFAFILQALCAKPPPESWHDKADKLDIWDVEYDDILSRIPVTERKRKEPRASPYKPQRWKGFKRSPIRTRSRCQQLDISTRRTEDDDDDEGPPSPSPNPPHASKKSQPSAGTASGRNGGKQGQHQGQSRDQGKAIKPNIQSRPFCTQKCLMGLAYGGLMDENCPNSEDHGQKHISRLEFLRLIRSQLATDRGRDADCAPLYLSGSRGSLFKVRLSSHGYTLVAKGMESLDRALLQHENKMYDRLGAIQGKHVPVCLGRVNLVLPYHYDSGVYVHFMFLSWAGQPLFRCVNQAKKAGIVDAVTTAYREMHKLRVLHRDAELRNILYNVDTGDLMVVDFERAEFRGGQPLGSLSPDGLNRKRKCRTSPKQWKDDFAKELEHAIWQASECANR